MKLTFFFIITLFPFCLFAESRTVELPDGGELVGTLLMPDEPRAMVILVSGSGPTDRDGNQPPTMVNNSLKMVAQALAEASVASFRFDKRGVGASGQSLEEASLRVETFADDLVAVTRQVRGWSDGIPLVLLGHSEGAMMAMLASQQVGVDRVISLAGPGRRGDEILREQLMPRLPDELAAELESILASLRQGEPVVDVSAALASLFRPSVQPYMVSWFAVDPGALAAALGDRLVVIQGSTDLQVAEKDACLLAESAGIEPVIITGMNHVLKAVEGDINAQTASYLEPDLALHPQLLPALLAAMPEHD